jgi:hypothetical protein
VLELVDGAWETLAVADRATPQVEVPVGEHGVVTLSLAEVLS